jgi:hypothetical protein
MEPTIDPMKNDCQPKENFLKLMGEMTRSGSRWRQAPIILWGGMGLAGENSRPMGRPYPAADPDDYDDYLGLA